LGDVEQQLNRINLSKVKTMIIAVGIKVCTVAFLNKLNYSSMKVCEDLASIGFKVELGILCPDLINLSFVFLFELVHVHYMITLKFVNSLLIDLAHALSFLLRLNILHFHLIPTTLLFKQI
jgi:hypothetical protein